MDIKELALKYKELKNENEKLIAINKKLIAINKKLIAINKKLNEELDENAKIPMDEITLSQFRRKYLTHPYDVEHMPKESGIYAYFNEKEQLLYIGQSVNMQNRLKQHFRRGSLNVNGHDSEFKDESKWSFYVLEYINRNDKQKLDNREAYWIALGKLAVSDKTIYNYEAANKYAENLLNPNVNLSDINLSKKIKGKGQLTNRTRGNNIKM